MLSHYDLDKYFAAYGFGAKSGADKKKRGFFPLSGNSNQTYIKGIQVGVVKVTTHEKFDTVLSVYCQGVISAYRKLVPTLRFSGPSLLAPVISEVTRLVAQQSTVSQNEQKYHVLMIITVSIVSSFHNNCLV